MTVACPRHGTVRFSGSEVRIVAGLGVTRAVVLSMAYLRSCSPAPARRAVAWRAIGSVTGATTRRDSGHSRVATDVITRRSSARAGASHSVTDRSRGTALANTSLSRISVPPGTAGERSPGVCPVCLLLSGLVEVVAQRLDLLVRDGTVLGLGDLDELV